MTSLIKSPKLSTSCIEREGGNLRGPSFFALFLAKLTVAWIRLSIVSNRKSSLTFLFMEKQREVNFSIFHTINQSSSDISFVCRIQSNYIIWIWYGSSYNVGSGERSEFVQRLQFDCRQLAKSSAEAQYRYTSCCFVFCSNRDYLSLLRKEYKCNILSTRLLIHFRMKIEQINILRKIKRL